MEIKLRSNKICRGDIVAYRDSICLVAECSIHPTIYLVNLDTGLVAGEFRDINAVRSDMGITLVAKGNEVKISNTEEALF